MKTQNRQIKTEQKAKLKISQSHKKIPNYILSYWLDFEKDKKNLKKSRLEEKLRLVKQFENSKILLAQQMVKLDAQWPMLSKHIEGHFIDNHLRQNNADFSRETFILRRGLSDEDKEILINDGDDDFLGNLETKCKILIKQTSPQFRQEQDIVDKVYNQMKKFMSRTNIGAISFEKANQMHEMEVVEPMRQTLLLEREISKIRFSKAYRPVEEFEAELENLPVLKHISHLSTPIYIDYSEGIVAVATTSFFKSTQLQRTARIHSEKSSYKYFAAYVESEIRYKKGEISDSARLLVFSQRSPF